VTPETMTEHITENPARRFIRYFGSLWQRFADIRDTPEKIALGFSLGLFVGMSPYMMCHTLMAVSLAYLFRGNRISAAVGVVITNPFTAPFFYRITWLAGKAVISTDAAFPSEFTLEALLKMLHDSPELLRVLTVGGIVTGIPLAVAGYYIAVYVIRRYREKAGNSLDN